MKLADLAGKEFGRYVVVRRAENDRKGNATWLCRCSCGNEKTVRGDSLANGSTTSCGCLQKEGASKRALVHGHNTVKGVSSEYTAWANMKNRCFNEKNEQYENYGGRGITVCESWLIFENFIKDMGIKPSKAHSIDRIDVNGNYEPNNCKWATTSEQSKNQRAHNKNKTGIRGVTWHNNTKKYVARIGISYKVISIGYYDTIDEAKTARMEAELKYWGKSS